MATIQDFDWDYVSRSQPEWYDDMLVHQCISLGYFSVSEGEITIIS
jgi:hypothetical protein